MNSGDVMALQFLGNARRGVLVAIGDHDMRAARGGQQRHFAANAAAAADDQGDAPAQFLLRRLAANLGFFQAQYSMRNASSAGSAT